MREPKVGDKIRIEAEAYSWSTGKTPYGKKCIIRKIGRIQPYGAPDALWIKSLNGKGLKRVGLIWFSIPNDATLISQNWLQRKINLAFINWINKT